MKRKQLFNFGLNLAVIAASASLIPLTSRASGGAAPKSLTQFNGAYELQGSTDAKVCPTEIQITGKDETKSVHFYLLPQYIATVSADYEMGEHCRVDASQDIPYERCADLGATSDSLTIEEKSRNTYFPGSPWWFITPEKKEFAFNGLGALTLTMTRGSYDYALQGTCTYLRK